MNKLKLNETHRPSTKVYNIDSIFHFSVFYFDAYLQVCIVSEFADIIILLIYSLNIHVYGKMTTQVSYPKSYLQIVYSSITLLDSLLVIQPPCMELITQFQILIYSNKADEMSRLVVHGAVLQSIAEFVACLDHLKHEWRTSAAKETKFYIQKTK